MDIEQKNAIKEASPLELPQLLINIELYDRQRAKDLFDEINEQFSRESMEENVIVPVFTTIADTILDLKCFCNVRKKLGLSSSRVVNECRSFNYEGRISMLMPDSFIEYQQHKGARAKWAGDNRKEYIRSLYANTIAMEKYKADKAAEGRPNKNIKDEYTKVQNITPEKSNPDLRRTDPKHRYNAETDHIVPLKEVFTRLQDNAGLSDGDIKDIANQDDNLAVTSRRINNAKRSMSNSAFIKLQDEKKARGEEYIELSPEVRENMLRMEQDANRQLNKSIDSTILKNLTGRGKADTAELKAVLKAKKEELGRPLTSAERKDLESNLARQKAINIHKGNAQVAAKQTLGYALGSVVLMILKPLYYEIKDGFINGFKEGVFAATYKEAFKIRFVRIKKYIISQICNLKNALGNFMDMVKNFISALVEGLIGMFAGMFRSVFRLLKEGIKVFMNVWPVLFGKKSKDMTPAQKGDAILKILGGSVIGFCGIAIDMQLAKLAFIPDYLRGGISTLLSGLASALMFYALDKADLFNVKADQRNQRIDEIFSERIKDLEESTHNFDTVLTEKLKRQKSEFNTLMGSIDNCFANNDLSSAHKKIRDLFHFLGYDLGYTDLEDFKNKEKEVNWNL